MSTQMHWISAAWKSLDNRGKIKDIRFQVDLRIFQVNRGKFSESSQSGEGSEVVVEYHQFLACDEVKMWCGKQSF